MGRTKKNETKVLSEDPKKTYKKLHTVHGKYLDILTYTTLTDDQKIMMDRVEKNIEKLYEKYGKEYFKDVVKSRYANGITPNVWVLAKLPNRKLN